MLPSTVRQRAREAREAAQRLVKQSRELGDRADVLMRELEVALRTLREAAVRESPRSSASSDAQTTREEAREERRRATSTAESRSRHAVQHARPPDAASRRRPAHRRDRRVRGDRTALHDGRREDRQVRRVENTEVAMIRTYGPHERVSAKRASAADEDSGLTGATPLGRPIHRRASPGRSRRIEFSRYAVVAPLPCAWIEHHLLALVGISMFEIDILLYLAARHDEDQFGVDPLILGCADDGAQAWLVVRVVRVDFRRALAGSARRRLTK